MQPVAVNCPGCSTGAAAAGPCWRTRRHALRPGALGLRASLHLRGVWVRYRHATCLRVRARLLCQQPWHAGWRRCLFAAWSVWRWPPQLRRFLPGILQLGDGCADCCTGYCNNRGSCDHPPNLNAACTGGTQQPCLYGLTCCPSATRPPPAAPVPAFPGPERSPQPRVGRPPGPGRRSAPARPRRHRPESPPRWPRPRPGLAGSCRPRPARSASPGALARSAGQRQWPLPRAHAR
jgi:hypothetical protein